jgi:hypothetical protein
VRVRNVDRSKRSVAEIILPDGRNLNRELVRAGLSSGKEIIFCGDSSLLRSNSASSFSATRRLSASFTASYQFPIELLFSIAFVRDRATQGFVRIRKPVRSWRKGASRQPAAVTSHSQPGLFTGWRFFIAEKWLANRWGRHRPSFMHSLSPHMLCNIVTL